METPRVPIREEKFEIIGGPSKFDLMEVFFSRKRLTPLKATFQLRDQKGNIFEVETSIIGLLAIPNPIDDFSCRDGDRWGLYSGPLVSKVWNIRFDGVLLGIYSTQTRKGAARRLCEASQFFLIEAAFGCEQSKNELENGGFKIPDVTVIRS
ncbi:MAG: hypothetical protein WCF94_01320 [bacterium]